jgi:hypothetical protein
MSRKIKELIQDLKNAGFYEIPGGGVKDRIANSLMPIMLVL